MGYIVPPDGSLAYHIHNLRSFNNPLFVATNIRSTLTKLARFQPYFGRN